VRFIGDPNQPRERRDGTEFMGVVLPLGEWVEMNDMPARKLSRNAHFEVDDLPPPPEPVLEAPAGDELSMLRLDFAELAQDREELIAAYRERGEQLDAARARIAELEVQLAGQTKPAEGEANGDDAAGTGEAGAAKAEGVGRGANSKRRGSADS
jgi:hypothetical protein